MGLRKGRRWFTIYKKAKAEDDDAFINHCYSPYSIFPYILASVICILVACFSGLQEIFIAIPTPILGGMELFVFGLITAPGIQMLVEQQVNYKKISNQIITASVLLAGISNISITYETLTLKGMSLGLVIGVAVNLLTLILRYFGYLNERFTLIEILDACADAFHTSLDFTLFDENSCQTFSKSISLQDFKPYIRRKDIGTFLKSAHNIELKNPLIKKRVVVHQGQGRMSIVVSLPNKYRNRLLNDHSEITIINQSNRKVTILIDEYISQRLLADILKNSYEQ